MNLPNYNQADPRWANEPMGTSGEIMRRFGCLVTAISSSLKAYGLDFDPGALCRKLSSVGGFDQHSNLLHEAIEKIHHNLVFYVRVYTTNSPALSQKVLVGAAMSQVNNLLDLGHPVMLEVDNVGNDGRPDHWVQARGHANGDYLVMNPDGGTEHWFSSRYGDPARKLFGYYAILGDQPEGPKLGKVAWKAAMVWKGKSVDTYSKEILDALIK